MLNIRTAIKKDAAPIICAHRDAVFSKGAGHYSQTMLEAWALQMTADCVEQIEQDIADPDFIALVAEAEGNIIGFAMAAPERNELLAVYVKPNRVGFVGRRLLAEIEDKAFATAEFLMCDASLNGEAFYKVGGYKEKGRTEHAFRSGVTIPCIKMIKFRPSPYPNH
jgi:hypothetical protein